MSKSRRNALVATLVVLTLGGAVWWWFSSGPDIPTPELSKLSKGARALIQKAQDEVKEHPKSALAWGALGMALMAHELRDDALPCLKQAEALSTQESKWPYLQALIHLQKGETDLALTLLQRAVEKPVHASDAPHLRLARFYLETGQNDRAAKEYLKLIQNEVSHPRAILGLARARAEEDVDEAIELLKNCQESRYAQKEAHQLLAELLFRKGEKEDAKEAQSKAEALREDIAWPDPIQEELENMKSSLHHLTREYQRLMSIGDGSGAQEVLRKAEQTYPELYWLVEGRMALQKGDAVRAESAFRKGIESNPAYVENRNALALAVLAQNQPQRAIKIIDELLKDHPDYGPAHLVKGQCLLKQGEDQKALQALENATRFSPMNAEAHFRLGELLVKLKQTRQAREELGLTLKLNPKHKEARKLLNDLK